ncbi:glycosyltransferase family 4 protein [Tenacibaculum aestuarii]|uniref:glycosyltransferase family 4 protein n=1 Tax=Tenacibaculum aestuarii TaxID=362781 RepID=UPI003894B985
MRIVYNTDQIYLHGGIEKVMATKVNYLAKIEDIDVYIITTEQKKKQPCYLLNSAVKLEDLGVNYQRGLSYFSWVNLKKAVKHLIKQRRKFKELQPDVVISPNYNFDHYWLPFIVPNKTKLIKELHSSRFYEVEKRKQKSFKNKLAWKLQDWIEAKYDYVVVLNDDEVKYRPGNNAVVIPNPTIVPMYQADVMQKNVMAAGRISPIKGFDKLIEAWQLVNKDFPDWQLHIYGDNYGNTKNDLQKLIKTLALEQSVTFKESVTNLPKAMLNYGIYVMSSETECFPTVLLEALSVGLPIVSFDCPNGPRHIVTHQKDGLLVEHQNVEALAEGVRMLINNDVLRNEFSSFAKTSVQRFEVNQVMKQWLLLFKKVS